MTVICGAPELEPRVKHPFGRAPAGAGVGAARGALSNRAEVEKVSRSGASAKGTRCVVTLFDVAN